MSDFVDEEWIECEACNGSGKDDTDPVFGRCMYCDGKGERLVRYSEDEDDEEASES